MRRTADDRVRGRRERALGHRRCYRSDGGRVPTTHLIRSPRDNGVSTFIPLAIASSATATGLPSSSTIAPNVVER